MGSQVLNGEVSMGKEAAMSRAMEAYTRCEELPRDDRRRLIDLAQVTTSVRDAIELVFRFAYGCIQNPWLPKSIELLTCAWLRLGENLFCLIYRSVRPKDSEPQGDLSTLLDDYAFSSHPELV